jgi:TonB family protein
MVKSIQKVILACVVSGFLIIIIPFLQLVKSGKYQKKEYKVVEILQAKEVQRKPEKKIKRIRKMSLKSHTRKNVSQSLGRFALDLSVSAEASDDAVTIAQQQTGIYKTWEVDVRPQERRILFPAFPKEAQEKEVEGRVILEMVISERGRVSTVNIIEEVPSSLGFGQAAVEAVRKWEFEPAMIEGIPVKYTYRRQIDFKLE